MELASNEDILLRKQRPESFPGQSLWTNCPPSLPQEGDS